MSVQLSSSLMPDLGGGLFDEALQDKCQCQVNSVHLSSVSLQKGKLVCNELRHLQCFGPACNLPPSGFVARMGHSARFGEIRSFPEIKATQQESGRASGPFNILGGLQDCKVRDSAFLIRIPAIRRVGTSRGTFDGKFVS